MKLNSYSQSSFDGGLNDTSDPRNITRTEASILKNWDIRYQGSLVRRDGLVQVGDTPTNVVGGMHGFARTNGNNDLLIMDGTSLKYLNSTVFSALDSGFTSGKDFSFETIPSLNRVYISNEDNYTHYWDRASTTLNSCLTDLGATKYNANKMVWFKNHLFFLNNLKVGATSYTDYIGFSDFNDPDTHDTTNNRFQVPGQGRIITACDLGDVLVLFKQHSIVYLEGYGETSWAITAAGANVANLSESVGCLAVRGCTRVGNEVWFVDDEGIIRRVMQTDFDAFRTDVISTKIQGTLATLNKSQLENVIIWANNDYVYVSFPTGSSTVNDTTMRFDLQVYKRTQEEAWTKITGWAPKFFADYISSTKSPDLMIANGTSKKIHRHDGDDDDGVAIDADWTGKDDDYDKVDQYKRYRMGFFTGESGTSDVDVKIYASVDRSSFANIATLSLLSSGSRLGPTGTDTLGPTGNFTLAGSAESEEEFYYTNGGGSATGKTVRHSIRHAVVDEQPTVRSFSSFYKTRDPR